MLNGSVLLSEPPYSTHLLDLPGNYHQSSGNHYPESESSLFSGNYPLIDFGSKGTASHLRDFLWHCEDDR
jgi:hypothetical protein